METSLASLSEDEREDALERYRLLKPFLEDGATLVQVARKQNVSLRTLRRWVRQYREAGLIGLVRKGRKDRGEGRRLSEEMEQFIEGLALQKPSLGAAAIHRQVCVLATQRNESPPSYSLVYAVVKRLPEALTVLAHEGSKAYSQRFDLVHRREAEAPNVLWQVDHSQLDVLLVREGKEPIKPWLTTVIDDYSRAIPGYYLSFDSPSTLATSLALRQAIWRKEDPRWAICGIPQTLYTDNGSDFTSEHIEQVAAELKIRLTFSLPGQPRGRGRVERFFETLDQMVLCELPGYAPGKGLVRDEPRLTLGDLDGRVREFLLDLYHLRPHSAMGLPPQERWAAGGFLPQMPISLEQLDLLLLTVSLSRKVHSDGLRFLGLRYIDPTLAAYVGEDVLLRYDPRDVAEVRVFHQGKFLCRAICQELAGETVPFREIVQARNRRRRELRQTLQERRRLVDRLLETRQWKRTEASEPEPASAPLEGSEEREGARPPIRRYFNE